MRTEESADQPQHRPCVKGMRRYNLGNILAVPLPPLSGDAHHGRVFLRAYVSRKLGCGK